MYFKLKVVKHWGLWGSCVYNRIDTIIPSVNWYIPECGFYRRYDIQQLHGSYSSIAWSYTLLMDLCDLIACNFAMFVLYRWPTFPHWLQIISLCLQDEAQCSCRFTTCIATSITNGWRSAGYIVSYLIDTVLCCNIGCSRWLVCVDTFKFSHFLGCQRTLFLNQLQGS